MARYTISICLAGKEERSQLPHMTINDCYDALRFEKPIDGTLKQVRALTGDGLFTAYAGEKVLNWFSEVHLDDESGRLGVLHIAFLCAYQAQ